ncbi:MAG: glycosyltransferase family 4 protein [Candidatus Magasanikiibacteriota bacterium]
MKKILVLNYEFPPLGGGASPVSYEIAKGYVKNGFTVDVVTMGFKGLPAFEVKDGINIYRVKCWRTKKEICHPWEQLTYIWSAKRFLKEHLKTHTYDINHTHFIIPTGVVSLWLKKKYQLPYIITSHGSDVLGYNKRFKLLYPFLVRTWKKILDNANKIISPSNFLKTEILKVYPQFSDKKIEKIPNGIDISKFTPQVKKKYIFSSGRLLVSKGFQYLIKAVSDEDLGYEVHIAGDGPMMSELKKMAEKSKTKIIFHGWLDNNGKEYKDLLEQSAIYVLASEKENASIALLEAMSAGCAIITTNVSGCPDTVGNAGLLVRPNDVVDLKLKINKIINDLDKLVELQKEALERVKITYDWGVVMKEYTKIL